MKKGIREAAIYCLIAASVLLAAYWGSQTATVMAENALVEREHCILIDPGHGGIDGGAISCTGKPESIYNLEISLRLRDLLAFLGHKTKMTREKDVSIYAEGETIAQKKVSDLKERVRIANSEENMLLLSIHQNTFSDSRYHGAQVFYAKTVGSRELAEAMQNTLLMHLNPGSNRKTKRSDGIYLLEHIQCPGILIECGFLSNPQEEFRLESTDYQKRLCCVIAGTVSQYLSNT